MKQKIRTYCAIAAGGALGSVARWFLSGLAADSFGRSFPWGTFIVNALGSFLIGLYFTITDSDGRLIVSPAVRQFVLAGVCGGFTTFSSFSLETILLANALKWNLALFYVAASIVTWLGAVWLGVAIGKFVNRPSWRQI